MAITNAEEREVPLCGSLRYGEMAIALYAAPGLPYPERPRLSPQELALLAAQGVNRVGGVDRVRALYRALWTANRALLRRQMTEALYEATVVALLTCLSDDRPDAHRLNRCLAYDYSRLGAS